MPQAVSTDLQFCADDSSLVFQYKDKAEIDKQLNINFPVCEWFASNNLCSRFDEDKSKSIFFGTKCKLEKIGKCNITYKGINITRV